jgi:aryl-alcohol dehydrogenase-like predicted oxidoreductase
MKYRKLGRTGFLVSEIGYGAWGIGRSEWIGAEDEISLKALNLAIDQGVNFVDTALAYGDGHSEKLVGKVIRERSERVYVATKIPPKNLIWPASADSQLEDVFPLKHVMSCTEKSLKHLGVDCLDLQQFHVWNDRWAGRSEWQEAVDRLKREGKVRYFGISVNDNQPENGLAAAGTGFIDTFQFIYNIFEQAPQDQLLPYCREHDLGTIVRVPLDEGSLTGNITPATTFPKGDFRNGYFGGRRKQEVMEHVGRLQFLLHDGVATLTEAALRFCLSHDAVTTVIVGMRAPVHVEANCAISDGRRLPKGDLEALRSHVWPHNYYS